MTQEEFQGLVIRKLDEVDGRLIRIEAATGAYWEASKILINLAFALIGASTISILAFIGARAFGWIH